MAALVAGTQLYSILDAFVMAMAAAMPLQSTQAGGGIYAAALFLRLPSGRGLCTGYRGPGIPRRGTRLSGSLPGGAGNVERASQAAQGSPPLHIRSAQCGGRDSFPLSVPG